MSILRGLQRRHKTVLRAHGALHVEELDAPGEKA
jgi:hypothetical protein